MQCALSPELDEQTLLESVDGLASEATSLHLQRCEYCRERAEALASFQSRLSARLSRLECPPSIALGEYHLRLLPAAQALVVAQHVRECPNCAREVAELDGFLSEADASMVKKLKVIVARLVGWDAQTGSLPAIAPLRGASNGPVTLEAEGMVIVLDVQPAPTGRLALVGQVAADDQDYWTNALVELEQNRRGMFSATLDDLGGFRYDELQPGPQELRLISRDGAVMVVSSFSVSD
jgi:hypothetical protein